MSTFYLETSFNKTFPFTRLIRKSFENQGQEIAIFNLDGILRANKARETQFLNPQGRRMDFIGYYNSGRKAPSLKDGIEELLNQKEMGRRIYIVSGYPDSRLFESCDWLERQRILNSIDQVWHKNGQFEHLANVAFKMECYQAITLQGRVVRCFDNNLILKDTVRKSLFSFNVESIPLEQK